MNHKLFLDGTFILTAEQLQELATIVEQQNTTDRDEQGDYISNCDYGTYHYRIDEDYDVILVKVEK